MPYYARLIVVVLILVSLSQFVPEVINAFLLIVLAGVVVMNSEKIAGLIAWLRL